MTETSPCIRGCALIGQHLYECTDDTDICETCGDRHGSVACPNERTDMLLIEDDTRKPTAGWLNYAPGVDAPNPHWPMGPNLLGELLWPVAIERTPERTRIGFTHVPPPRANA